MKGEKTMSEALNIEKIETLEDIPEGWRIEDDKAAEWCVEKLREAEADKEFWKAHYAKQLESVNRTNDETIERMKGFLREYFDRVPHKKTKTQENYPLPSGKLVMKHVEPEYQRDDKDVIEWLKANRAGQFIKTKESLDWAEMKKSLTVIGETVADEDGQIIPCIRAVAQPDKFSIDK
jgi:phage host-nuclease inhibitor protein Gam